MDSIVSSKPTDQGPSKVALRVRRVAATVLTLVAVALVAAGVLVPLLVLEDWLLAGAAGGAIAAATIFFTSPWLTLAAVMWGTPRVSTADRNLQGPALYSFGRMDALSPELTGRLLGALGPDARQRYVTTRVRTTGQYRGKAASTAPTRTYFVNFRDPSGQVPALYVSLTKEGMSHDFEVPRRQQVRETLATLAATAGRVIDTPTAPFKGITLMCGERGQWLLDPSVPLTKLEHPDLRDTWWATPDVFAVLSEVPAETLVDLLNEYGQPGIGVQTNEGWAVAWVNSAQPGVRRVDLLAHALMHLTNHPRDYQYLYGLISSTSGGDPVLGSLKSDTIARAAATRRDIAGLLAIIGTGSIALIAGMGSGPEHWADGFWKTALVQVGVLIIVGVIVIAARPNHVTQQRRVGEQILALTQDRGWRLRRNLPRVGNAFPWFPFAAVIELAAGPIADPVSRATEPLAGDGAAYLYGDIGRWPRRRPFAARAVWVRTDVTLPRTDIVDRSMPARVTRTLQGDQFTLEHADTARWRLSASDARVGQSALVGRPAALLSELPPGQLAIHIVNNTVMVWDTAVSADIDVEELRRWLARFVQALIR